MNQHKYTFTLYKNLIANCINGTEEWKHKGNFDKLEPAVLDFLFDVCDTVSKSLDKENTKYNLTKSLKIIKDIRRNLKNYDDTNMNIKIRNDMSTDDFKRFFDVKDLGKAGTWNTYRFEITNRENIPVDENMLNYLMKFVERHWEAVTFSKTSVVLKIKTWGLNSVVKKKLGKLLGEFPNIELLKFEYI